VEEVLSPVQHAHVAQGNEVTAPARLTGLWQGVATTVRGTPEFLREVRKELEKVTWPDRAQLRQATITIIIFVLLIGAFIALMDKTLEAVLVRGIPSLFGV
jgi:preprotein translocase SecE subunit